MQSNLKRISSKLKSKKLLIIWVRMFTFKKEHLNGIKHKKTVTLLANLQDTIYERVLLNLKRDKKSLKALLKSTIQ